MLQSGFSVLQLPNLFQKYNHSRQGHHICWVPSRMKCDGIVGDQKLDCFSVYMACPTHYYSFELNVFHSLRAGSMPGADDGVPYWDTARLSNQICGWTLSKYLDLIRDCQKLHEWWLFFLIPKALSGIINDCKMFHDPAVAVIYKQYSLSFYWLETVI